MGFYRFRGLFAYKGRTAGEGQVQTKFFTGRSRNWEHSVLLLDSSNTACHRANYRKDSYYFSHIMDWTFCFVIFFDEKLHLHFFKFSFPEPSYYLCYIVVWFVLVSSGRILLRITTYSLHQIVSVWPWLETRPDPREASKLSSNSRARPATL